ncbi:MAG: hypothetical protein VX817_02980 [Candidatus Thermoplasmatota archaeon]|nr:hypothetical protein [Candidatus Thermoplasmatota archaeon]
MRLAILFSLVFISSTFAGCLDFSDDKVSTWPDKTNADCNLTTAYEFVCDTYLENSETPIVSLTYNFSKEIWIAYLDGKIVGWDGETLRKVGNLRSTVSRCHYEQGLLGMAFLGNHSYEKVLVSYIENAPCEGSYAAPLVLAEISIVGGILDTESLKVLEKIEQPYRNHNSGHIIYAMNNQYLWGIGDGGSSNDPHANGQNESTPLGTIRLLTYNDEIVELETLHTGLRNPWRFDIDSEGGMWIADVGQACFEELNYIELWNQTTNFGWSVREGAHIFDSESNCDAPSTEPPEEFTDPVIEYKHAGGNCSITGGFWMDWGPSELQNGYLYGDFCTGIMWLAKKEGNIFTRELIADTDIQITGFGRGLNDELLIFDWGGRIVKLMEISDSNVNS